jgi:hypothetical protein
MMTHPLELYYLQQAGRGGSGHSIHDIGLVYSVSPFVQRGHELGCFLGGLFRTVRTFLWRGARVVGREALRTGGKILTDIAENQSPNVSTRHIVSKHVNESTQNLIRKLRGRGRKRKRGATRNTIKTKRVKLKRDIFS